MKSSNFGAVYRSFKHMKMYWPVGEANIPSTWPKYWWMYWCKGSKSAAWSPIWVRSRNNTSGLPRAQCPSPGWWGGLAIDKKVHLLASFMRKILHTVFILPRYGLKTMTSKCNSVKMENVIYIAAANSDVMNCKHSTILIECWVSLKLTSVRMWG